jgi:UDP-glucose:(heptosyl)LPS alpha-1,3-glucosyltransferase
MRLLLYTRIFRLTGSGAEDYAVRLCQGLASRGHEVHVVADEISDVPTITTHTGTARIEEIKNSVNPDLTIDWGFVAQADIHRMGSGVHAEFMKYSLDAYRGISRLYKRFRYQSRRHRQIIETQHRLLTQPNSWFLPNSWFCAEQARAGGANPVQTITLHNGVDTSRFSPAKNPEPQLNMRQQWGVENNDVLFLFVAHNLRLKNYPLLAKIFRQLNKNHPEFKLIVAGKHKPRLMPSNCIYVGMPADMSEAYRTADVLLHPTFYDSCANVVLEAMSSGLAVVVSDRCGANELIQDRHNGYVLPVTGNNHDVAENWQSIIQQLGRDSQQRKLIGDQAREHMLQHNFDRYVDQFETILQKLCAN